VDEVDAQPVDRRPILRERVEPGLRRSPVEIITPVVAQLPQVARVGPWVQPMSSSAAGMRARSRRDRRSVSTSSGTSMRKGVIESVIAEQSTATFGRAEERWSLP
jgi:hypothetical protein